MTSAEKLAKKLIAVVDDESPVRVMLGRLLRLADYSVCEFSSGEDFLSSLSERLPFCAILDIHMPGLSGFDVQLRMRAIHPRIPVVFITASDDLALDRLASDLDANEPLRKPFSNDALLAAIGAAVGRPA